MRVLELFAGIGGCAAAVAGRAEVVEAVDQNPYAARVYEANHGREPRRWNLAGVRVAALADARADLWWMSPPCQPFTVRGAGRDVDDPRSRAFLRVLDAIEEVRPWAVALENVPPFQGSLAHARLRAALARAGYDVRERLLCPTALGVPNRRLRYYLLATRAAVPPWADPAPHPRPVAAYLDPNPDPVLLAEPELLARFGGALSLVDPRDEGAVAACFTAAYGRSPVAAGPYLRGPDGIRRFSPIEIARLLGFPAGFGLPDDLPRQRAWALVGNSLSVDAVRCVLSPLLRD